tara:strand:- start:465 stop:653 length:189 start_codon:yes stop_codon:yes gene_type:complete
MLSVLCHAVRLTTNSKITIEIPPHVGADPYACVQWIGEEFDWAFIPMHIEIKPEKNNEEPNN